MLRFFKRIFKFNSYQSELERYIISKRPLNAADVEHLTREFALKQSRSGL